MLFSFFIFVIILSLHILPFYFFFKFFYSLTKPDIALELVRLVTQEPQESENPENRFVLPNLACEILTSDIQPMYNVLSHEEEIWKCFFSFLEDNEPPLNSLMASYFSRTLCSLILKTGSQVCILLILF